MIGSVLFKHLLSFALQMNKPFQIRKQHEKLFRRLPFSQTNIYQTKIFKQSMYIYHLVEKSLKMNNKMLMNIL